VTQNLRATLASNTLLVLPFLSLTLMLQVANIPGFIGNRCIFTYAMESMLLLEEKEKEIFTSTGGLSVQRIDAVIR
jgi:3-hydroxyacyl-CoA dehydrogenase